MKVAIINRSDKGSTGYIASLVFKALKQNGNDAIFIGANQDFDSNGFSVETNYFIKQYNRIFTKISGLDGFYNKSNTKKIIKILDNFKPDLVMLHNLHGYYINVPMLFNYLHTHQIKVVWTLHDCWSFTGKCPYFEIPNCSKWKEGCHNCPINKEYPRAYFFDKTSKMYKIKKDLFSFPTLKMHIVCPSDWLLDYARQSFLKNNFLHRIHNGIDIQKNISSFSIPQNKKTKLLFMAHPWSFRKGIESIKFLIDKLDFTKHQILIAGLEKIDAVISNKDVILLGKVDHNKIGDLFNYCDVFVNPTLEDNLPTVDIESIAYHRPVISFDTGGSKEIIGECGILIKKGDNVALLDAINSFNPSIYPPEKFEERKKYFSSQRMCDEYIKLFEGILKKL